MNTSVQVHCSYVQQYWQPGSEQDDSTSKPEGADQEVPQVGDSTSRLESVEAFAFDLDGTLYLQGTPLPGTVELLQQLRNEKIPHLFMTNNSSVSKATYVKKLAVLGGPPREEQILTSNDVALTHLRAAGLKRPYLLGTTEVRAEYAGHGVHHSEDEPDCVLLTFDMELDFARIAAASRHIAAGLPYLATHPDVTCPIPGGFLPDAGSFIEMFAAATGRRPEVLGKPHEGTIRAISERLRTEPDRIAFVGDRLTTDIAMGVAAGFVSILTLTGVTGPEELQESSIRPELTVSGMPELLALLGERSIIRS